MKHFIRRMLAAITAFAMGFVAINHFEVQGVHSHSVASAATAPPIVCWYVLANPDGIPIGTTYTSQPTFLPPGDYVATSYACGNAIPLPSASPSTAPTATGSPGAPTPVPTATPTPGPINVNIVGGSTSFTGASPIPYATASGTTLVVHNDGSFGTGSGGSSTFNGIISNTAASPVPIYAPVALPVTGAFFPATQPVSIASPVPVTIASPISVIGNFFPTVQPVSISSPVPVTIASPIAVTGSFFQATQPVSIASPVAVTIASPVAVTGTFFLPVQPVSIASPVPVTIASPVAVTGAFFPATQPVSIAAPVAVTGSFYQATQPVSQVNPFPRVNGSPQSLALGTVSNSTTQVKLALSGTAFSTEFCDFENMDGVSVISPTIAYDAADASVYQEFAYQLGGPSFAGPSYLPTINSNGLYSFDVRGAAFLNFPVTTIGANQNASITCTPHYVSSLPTSLDSSGNQNVNIQASAPLVTSTSPPAPTVVPNWMAVTKGCPSAAVSVNAVISCHSDPTTGNEIVSSLTLKDSANLGNPDAAGLFADNPANTACNNGVKGTPCLASLNSTTLTTIATGLVGKSVYLLGLQVTNTSSTNAYLSFVQGSAGICGTNQVPLYGPVAVPAGFSGIVLPLSVSPYANTLATNGMCAQLSSALTGGSVFLNAQIGQF